MYGIAHEVQGSKGPVIGCQLGQGLGARDLVVAQVQDTELQQPVKALHLCDLVAPHVDLPQRDASSQTWRGTRVASSSQRRPR